ncbi:thioredoxin family protein [Balneolales bacterium ANBcel1]|nr:thioredoxin family protein [Balneolales bacterium ANBcel1]
MARTPSNMVAIGTPAPDFSLPDPAGTLHSRDQIKGKNGLLVVFYCNHCPFVKHIRERFAELASEYMKQGVGIVAINSNDITTHPEDAPEKMAEDIERFGYEFPYLFDESQEVAQDFGAACTPDFFLYDADLTVFYRGQFDDSRPGNDQPVTGADLSAAIEALVRGEEPPQEQKPSIGCNIKWKKSE